MIRPIIFLIFSNIFMTYAWYGHLKDLKNKPMWTAIFLSWLVAFFEYSFQVPANRIGINYYSLPQLKVMEETIAMVVFGVFSVMYMNVPITRNFVYASICLILACYFMFKPTT